MPAHLLENMVGRIYSTKGGTSCTITSYTNSKNLTVQFNDFWGYEKIACLQQLKLGSVRNPYDKTVFGIGFIGDGKHSPTDGSKATLVYEHWRSMLLRCYCSKTQKRNPTYLGCIVDERWHNFQNFAEWFLNQNYYECGYELDKDILVKGNKVYSPETCCLVPKEINSTFNSREAARGNYPQGVSPYNRTNKFKSSIRIGGKKVNLGVYKTVEDAYKAYIVAKESRVKSLAVKWEGRIEYRVFKVLIGWKFI